MSLQRLCLLGMIVLALAACGGGKKDVAVPPTISRSTAPPTATTGPTGIPGLDSVIAAVASKDEAAWEKAVKLTPLACTTTASVTDKPSCQPGEAADTQVPVLQQTTDAGHCNIAVPYVFSRASDLPGLMTGLGTLKLYTVYVLHTPGGTPLYGIVYAATGQTGGYAVQATRLQVQDDQVVGMDYYCRASLDDLIADVSPQDIVLPPQIR